MALTKEKLRRTLYSNAKTRTAGNSGVTPESHLSVKSIDSVGEIDLCYTEGRGWNVKCFCVGAGTTAFFMDFPHEYAIEIFKALDGEKIINLFEEEIDEVAPVEASADELVDQEEVKHSIAEKTNGSIWDTQLEKEDK